MANIPGYIIDWQKGYFNIRVDVNNGSKCLLLQFSSSNQHLWKLKSSLLSEMFISASLLPIDIYFLGVNSL